MSPEDEAAVSVMSDVHASGWNLLFVTVLAVVLYGLLRAARFGIDVAPLSSQGRETLRRAYPVTAGLVGVLYLLFSAGVLLQRHPHYYPAAVAVILGGALAASWFGVRDVVSGIFLKAGRVCRVGDYVRVGDVQGRVERMGYRVLVVETARGEEAILPYHRVADEAVLRTPVAERGTLHVFQLDLPHHPPVAETKQQIREGALRCHWSSIARAPEIAVVDGRRFEVTVFALDSDHVREVEDEVRRAVGAPRKPVRSSEDETVTA